MDLHELAKQFAEKEKVKDSEVFNAVASKYIPTNTNTKTISKATTNKQIYENAEKFNINLASFLIGLLKEHEDAKPCKYADCTTCIHYNPDLGCKEEDEYEWVDKVTAQQLISNIPFIDLESEVNNNEL